jgi:hypothetical protein
LALPSLPIRRYLKPINRHFTRAILFQALSRVSQQIEPRPSEPLDGGREDLLCEPRRGSIARDLPNRVPRSKCSVERHENNKRPLRRHRGPDFIESDKEREDIPGKCLPEEIQIPIQIQMEDGR